MERHLFSGHDVVCVEFHRGINNHNNNEQSGIERVQTLADISRSALCCYSNETRAPIAQSCTTNGHPLPFPKLHWGRAVVWECGEGQTGTQSHRRA